MGKGDQRSRRGKIWRGTFGKRRPKRSKSGAPAATEPPVEEKKTRKQPATGEPS
jgi:ribosomal small subunit protein bTHX